MIIVLVTSGKRENADCVTVKLFSNKSEAEQFCQATCDDPEEDKKYWKWAEIIEEGREYEPSRYKNW